MNHEPINIVTRRLKAINWNSPPIKGRLNSSERLMDEFLRRLLQWNKALKCGKWPYYSVGKCIFPELQVDEAVLADIERPNFFIYRTFVWLLEWASIQNHAETKSFNLPNPYEPLIFIYERGSYISREGQMLELHDAFGALKTINLLPSRYENLVPFLNIDLESLALLDSLQ